MNRLSQIDPADWDPALQELMHPEQRTPLENGLMRYFAHRPDLTKGLIAFSGGLKRERTSTSPSPRSSSWRGTSATGRSARGS